MRRKGLRAHVTIIYFAYSLERERCIVHILVLHIPNSRIVSVEPCLKLVTFKHIALILFNSLFTFGVCPSVRLCRVSCYRTGKREIIILD